MDFLKDWILFYLIIIVGAMGIFGAGYFIMFITDKLTDFIDNEFIAVAISVSISLFFLVGIVSWIVQYFVA